MTADILSTLGGLIVLLAGAEGLVRGASSLAARLGVPPVIVGLTVVAFGTSTPEVAVSVQAAASGQGGVALGNVVGSNIFNILVILGIAAVTGPLLVQARVVRQDVPVMVGVSFLPLLMAQDGGLGRGDGIVLLALLAAYLGWLGLAARRSAQEDAAAQAPSLSLPGAVALGLGGLVLLGLGSNLLVDGASGLARAAGVSELVIGLTLVAAGTSLPELATSVLAGVRGERDLAVGNAVGSNVFNVLGVLGAGAAASGSLPVDPGVLGFDFPVMIAVAVACLPVFLTGAVITRVEGTVFLLYYGLYLTYLGLHTTDHALEDEFAVIILGVVLPLTLAVGGALWVRGEKEAPATASPGRGPEAQGGPEARRNPAHRDSGAHRDP